KPDIDPLVLETFDPPVQPLQHCLAQNFRIGSISVTEDVRIDPERVMVVKTHKIEAELRKASGLQSDILMRAHPKQGISCEIGSPKTGRRAVFEDESISRDTQKTVLARRLLRQIKK